MSSVEKIKERLGIVDVVSSYLKLEKAGSNYRVRCPFHDEKTPSFFVSPSRDSYHCFGCDRGGDIFSFVEEMEGLDFKGSLKVLAEKAGVQLVYVDSKKKDKKERLYALMDMAATLFQMNLTKNSEALEYLYKRGLKASTLKNFRIGFAKDGWDDIYKFLKSKNYSDIEIEKAGLIIKKDTVNSKSQVANYYDRFRSRIMFPISDSAGRVVAFSGRIFSDGRDASENISVGKYINSPATELYNKSQILYGYDKAKVDIRKKNKCILVEGQMDLLMAHQVGDCNTVAISGTALTDEHISMIKRLAETIILSFDSDNAGFVASGKSARKAMFSGIEVRVVVLPNDLDPADIILKNHDEWKKLVSDAKHIVDFYIDTILQMGLKPREFKIKVGKLVLPFVKLIKNKIEQEHFISKIAEKLNVTDDSVRDELHKIVEDSDDFVNSMGGEDTTEMNNNIHKDRIKMIEDKIIGILLWQNTIDKPNIQTSKYVEYLEEILSKEEVEKLFIIEEQLKNKMIFNAEVYLGENIEVESELNELLLSIKKELLKKNLKLVEDELRIAEKNKNSKLASTIFNKFQKLSKKLTALNNSKYLYDKKNK